MIQPKRHVRLADLSKKSFLGFNRVYTKQNTNYFVTP